MKRRVPEPLRGPHDAADAGVRLRRPLLDALDAHQGVPWGIVTNKAERFAVPLVAALKLHPAHGHAGGRRHHAALPSRTRRRCWRRPGAWTVPRPSACTWATTCATCRPAAPPAWPPLAAAWGYLGQGEAIEAWGADHLLQDPCRPLEAGGHGLR